ncbi:hypothetical protein AgCh_007673 [Apium graveolens]
MCLHVCIYLCKLVIEGWKPPNGGTPVKPPPPVMNSGEPVFNKKMDRLRRTARKSVPGGPYRVEGFRLAEQLSEGYKLFRVCDEESRSMIMG